MAIPEISGLLMEGEEWGGKEIQMCGTTCRDHDFFFPSPTIYFGRNGWDRTGGPSVPDRNFGIKDIAARIVALALIIHDRSVGFCIVEQATGLGEKVALATILCSGPGKVSRGAWHEHLVTGVGGSPDGSSVVSNRDEGG